MLALINLFGVAGVVFIVAVGVYMWRGHSRNTMATNPGNSVVQITIASSSDVNTMPNTDIPIVETDPMKVSIQLLRSMTHNFSEGNILGKGGFGMVYKGELDDGTNIAVRRIERGGVIADDMFNSELSVLAGLRHSHVVGLFGYCVDVGNSHKFLIYEYMSRGSLSRHLFHWEEEELRPLQWMKRLTIALDVARGIEYLHCLARQNRSFIHRDLKPSHILLDDGMRAKIAGFGLARVAPKGNCLFDTRPAGTLGYLAPEYAETGRVTTKVDVFSFGVILMELISGREALDESQPDESVHLVNWFLVRKDRFRDSIDPSMDLDEKILASISAVAELARHCTATEPSERPHMGHVIGVLSSLAEPWKPTVL